MNKACYRTCITFLSFLLLVAFFHTAQGQTKESVIKLKSGTELKGTIISIAPMDTMVFVISGIKMTIKMKDVQSIEEYRPDILTSKIEDDKHLSEKTIITDFAEYPDSIELQIDGRKLKMLLVRGGHMNMGFDGRHSLRMKSEPVHSVSVTSFYLSEDYVSQIISSEWDMAHNIVTRISNEVNMPLRLPTEAEWEYAACSSIQHRLFNTFGNLEFCSDYFAEFKEESEVDPIGPSKGKEHVFRRYSEDDMKFDRSGNSYQDEICYIRIAIKAKDISALRQPSRASKGAATGDCQTTR